MSMLSHRSTPPPVPFGTAGASRRLSLLVLSPPAVHLLQILPHRLLPCLFGRRRLFFRTPQGRKDPVHDLPEQGRLALFQGLKVLFQGFPSSPSQDPEH